MKSLTLKDDTLRVIREHPTGISLPEIRYYVPESYDTLRGIIDELVSEFLVRKEVPTKILTGLPLAYIYYPIIEVPVEAEFVHVTMVYNKKTKDKQGSALDISLTYDFDCKNTKETKDTLKKFLFLKSHTWLDAKFGDRIPLAEKWAEEKERPTESEVVEKLKRENLDFTALHFKWSYYRQAGGKSEELEGDLEDWEKDLETGATWGGAKKGRKKGEGQTELKV